MERAGLTAQGQPAGPAASTQTGVGEEKTRFCATGKAWWSPSDFLDCGETRNSESKVKADSELKCSQRKTFPITLFKNQYSIIHKEGRKQRACSDPKHLI